MKRKRKSIEAAIRYDQGINQTVVNLNRDLGDGIERRVIYQDKNNWLIKKIGGARLAREALRFALDAVNKYVGLPDDEKSTVVGNALWYFSIIQYSKCYKQNEGWIVSLDWKQVYKNAAELQRNHAEFVNERDTFIAHGGFNYSSDFVVGVHVRKDDPKRIDAVDSFITVKIEPAKGWTEKLKTLIEVTQEHLIQSERKLMDKLLFEMTENGYRV